MIERIGSPRSFGWLLIASFALNDEWEMPTGEHVLLDKGAVLYRCPKTRRLMIVPPPPPHGSDPHLPFDPLFFDH